MKEKKKCADVGRELLLSDLQSPGSQNAKPRGHKIRATILSFLLLTVALTSCGHHLRQTGENLERLRSAQDRLVQNPKDKEALSVILTLLKDRRSLNRTNAARVLGQVGEKVGADIKDEAVPPLINLLETGDGSERQAASAALRDFGPHAKAAIPALMKALRSGEPGTASDCAEALGRMVPEAKVAIPALIEALNANKIPKLNRGHGVGGPQLAFYAADALAKFGPDARQAVPALKEKLQHPNGEFKIHLAQAIRRIEPNDAESLQVLIDLLNHGETYIQKDALTALGELGKNARPAIPAIKGYIKNKPGEWELECATDALKKIEGND